MEHPHASPVASNTGTDGVFRASPVSMKRPGAIIVGASSGIGAALARTLVTRGYTVALVARRLDRLETLANELNTITLTTKTDASAAPIIPVAKAYQHDVREYAAAPALFERILADFGETSALWLVIYNAGVMGEEDKAGEVSFDQEQAVVEINVIGAIRWLDLAAEALVKAGGGVIAGISSVAGDRGRRGNSAYQASKAGLTTYLESLRYRLRPSNVLVVTIKPGYVATEMTAGKRIPHIIVLSAEKAAERIVRACQRGDRVIYVPGYWAIIMTIVRLLPTAVMSRLPL